MGKQLLLSTGAQIGRTLGRPAPLPTTEPGLLMLGREINSRLEPGRRDTREWALLLESTPSASTLSPGAGVPPPPRDFTDRLTVVRQLKREATRPAKGRSRAALLWGPPGIGCGVTALYFAAEHSALHPDGQFYVDLRDVAGDQAVEPVVVLQRVLREMNVGPDDMPATESGCQDLYRRLTNGRRALVVIDHATSAAQVRPLIPNTPELFLLVVASGPPFALDAQRIEVPPLTDRDAKELLKRAAGAESVALAKARLPGILERCAGNGYALRAAAARLLAVRTPLAGPLDRPRSPDPVRSTVRAVCAGLPPATVRLCRLVALGNWPAVNADLAGWAADISPDDAAPMLAEAADAQLIQPLGDGRYRFRPEVCRYFADTAGPELGVPACSAAVARMLTGLLRQAEHAAHAALPQSWRVAEAPEQGEPYAGEAEGLAALVAERANLLRAVPVAEEYQHVETCLRLARALWPLVLKAGHWAEALSALRTAARCADEWQPESRTSAALHFQLAHCLGQLRRWEEAEGEALTAVAHERHAGHLLGEASSIEYLGLLHLYQLDGEAAVERFAEARRCYLRIVSAQGEEDRHLRRALALLERHRGRALWVMGALTESRAQLESARAHFEREGERYNLARTLTDLAETAHAAGDNAEALAHIAEAERLLPADAAPHLRYLTNLRCRCEADR
ncbi:tetratricopeptide repeat protein [Streptomyces iconiensis]|uniref:Tetratricopeptide repeat protein n=1 Tax=Streptomyces iconiensis TaxID=1384038 RepID=A0ABT6ZX94_9ACTN|nr:tetratricopeptide repeat protein [Streptomyces iconiensis]MDJ1133467.1 tetratricopeptide repeat protein [Streptomyces iconiensis]